MKKQEISFKSDNLNLYGEIYFPETINQSRPVLCLCHGIPAVTYNPEERGYAILAENFCTSGFITLIFNFRGAGLSQGNFDLLGWTHDRNVSVEIRQSM